MNTKYDYEYIRDNNIEGWGKEWKLLLEGRFLHDLTEDTNCKLYQLGFTVEEVEEAIKHEGYTDREIEIYSSQPELYELKDGKYVEIVGARDAIAQKKRVDELLDKLSEVDAKRGELQAGTFEHNGHNYYINPLVIVGQLVGMSLLPADYTRQWKTADKDVDGVSNIYVKLDKAGFTAMAMAGMVAWGANWDKADAVKADIKALFLDGKEVASFNVDLA